MTRNATWNNVGTDISTATAINDALDLSKLNFTVEKAPLFYGDSKTLIPDKVATVRQDTNEMLGIVGKKYNICQNEDAFSFVDTIDNVEFVKGGQIGGVSYLIGKLDGITILGDDFVPYLILQNSFDGSTPVCAAITPLRLICQNQFAFSFKNAKNTIRLRHSSQIEYKVKEGVELLKKVSEYMSVLSKRAEIFATTDISDATAMKVLDKLYQIPEDASDCVIRNLEEKKANLIAAYNTDDNANFRGTVWGWINAYSDFITHEEPTRKTKGWQDKRFMRVSRDGKILDNFAHAMMEMAA